MKKLLETIGKNEGNVTRDWIIAAFVAMTMTLGVATLAQYVF